MTRIVQYEVIRRVIQSFLHYGTIVVLGVLRVIDFSRVSTVKRENIVYMFRTISLVESVIDARDSSCVK